MTSCNLHSSSYHKNTRTQIPPHTIYTHPQGNQSVKTRDKIFICKKLPNLSSDSAMFQTCSPASICFLYSNNLRFFPLPGGLRPISTNLPSLEIYLALCAKFPFVKKIEQPPHPPPTCKSRSFHQRLFSYKCCPLLIFSYPFNFLIFSHPCKGH